MAGNVVTLAFAGDSSKIDKTFTDVGAGAQKMAGKVESASHEMRGGFDNVAEGIDESERKFRGIGDTIGGTGDIMQAVKDGDVIGLAMGFADLAGGITDFVVPAIKSLATRFGFMTAATEAQTVATGEAEVAQGGLNAMLLANPIGLVVAAIAGLIAAGVLLWKNWDTVKAAFSSTWGWISDRFGDLVDFVGQLPGKIARAASGMWDGLKTAFRAAINWIIRGWNAIDFKIPGFHIGPVGYDGFTLGLPDIPELHTGGTVPGVPGTEVPIMALAGEQVGRGAGGIVINFNGIVGDPNAVAQQLLDLLQRRQSRTGALGLT